MAEPATRLEAIARRPRAKPPDLSRLDPADWHPAAIAAARIVWQRRAATEADAVAVAEALLDEARTLRLSVSHLAAIERLVEDERGHVALATAVLARLGSAPGRVEPAPRPGNPTPEERFARLVLTGLATCESVSAARFVTVRAHTDLEVPRRCIELFLRDELAHARLGFLLVPAALEGLGRVRRDPLSFVHEELRGTFRALDELVGLHGRELPPPRPQPSNNPGIVEPALDAHAFRRAMEKTVLPRFEALGLPAREAWEAR